MKTIAAIFLGASLFSGTLSLAFADDKYKEKTKIDEPGYKEETKVKEKNGEYEKDSTVKEPGYKETTKVKSKHGKTKIETKVKGTPPVQE